MVSHKSPSSQQYKATMDSRDILATRRAVATCHAEGTSAPQFDNPNGHGFESTTHYHWRLLHKNLAKPVLRSHRAKRVTRNHQIGWQHV